MLHLSDLAQDQSRPSIWKSSTCGTRRGGAGWGSSVGGGAAIPMATGEGAPSAQPLLFRSLAWAALGLSDAWPIHLAPHPPTARGLP